VFCTVGTPFHEDGSVDEEALRVQIQRLVAARTGLYLAIGGASEAHVLTNAEMKRICEIGVEEAKGKVQVNAGLKECRSAAAVIELARDARDAGVDAIQIYQLDAGHGMIPTVREQEAYWNQILTEIDHPVIINIHYESKFKAPMKLLLDLVERYPQIHEFDAVGSQQPYFLELRDTLPRHLRVNCGAPQFVQYVTLGASGYINPLNNIIPYVGRSLVDAWMAGDTRQLSIANLTMQRFLRIVEQWAPSTARWVKMAQKVQGLGNGVLRLPYLLPPDEELQKMASQFRAMHLDEIEAAAKEYVEAHA
jgi:4-hydroxy-tetrahydrodipicolinate synthase